MQQSDTKLALSHIELNKGQKYMKVLLSQKYMQNKYLGLQIYCYTFVTLV